MENPTLDTTSIAYRSEQVIGKLKEVVIGQERSIHLMWAALITGGHVLLEGVPGLGKTLMVRTLGQVIDASFARIQFTPDLMPADITGTKVYDLQSGRFTFKRGPLFTHLLLADEINRTPPKTQSALLEAMEEGQITVDGEAQKLPGLFFVVATQNPVEYEGTYPLPEAQLDRFALKLTIDYPGEEEEVDILRGHRVTQRRESTLQPIISAEELLSFRHQVEQLRTEDSVIHYVAALVRATRNYPQVLLGASPRAGTSILSLSRAMAALDARDYVTPDDVKSVIQPALRHRLIMSPDVELEGFKTDDLIEEITRTVPVPR